jgi:endonuclease G
LPDIKAIAFLLRNEGSSRDIKEFAITVDSLERFTSYDFFFKTDRDFMEKVERELNLAAWGL